MQDGGTDSGDQRGSIGEKSGNGWTLISAAVCMMTGVVASGRVCWGEPFRAVLIGWIYGLLIGFCAFVFAVCLAMLVTLPLGKRAPRLADAVFLACLLAAPVLAWFVVGATLGRLM